VRVRGIEVGTVERVKAGPDPLRSSRMTLRITGKDVAVHEDARATIRWRTVLGGSMFVDLEPGSPRAGKLDGAIPRSQTASQVELDDILRIYDGQTEQRQRDTFRGLSDGFSDPDAFGEAIRALPKLRTVARGLEPLRGRESGDLRRAVAATATTVEALGADIGELQTLVTGARRTFGATRAKREELGEFLERSPATLDSTKVTMRRVRTTLDRLDPLARELRPGVRALRPAVDRIRPALVEAEGLLTEIQPSCATRARRSGTSAPQRRRRPDLQGPGADDRPAQLHDDPLPR
jgi:phospholipid/cholesterol/gamma-HCH transport system substrate-binding protein